MSSWIDVDFLSTIRNRPTDYIKRSGQAPDLFSAVGVMHPEIEGRAKYIYNTQNIYNAHGIELDRFGEYVDESRDGRDDDSYRHSILIAKMTSQFSGTPPNVMSVAALATNSVDVEIVEMRPAAHSIHVTGIDVPTDINNIVDKASVAGVRAYVTHDYGFGGFSLAGVSVDSGYAMAVDDDTAMQVEEATALGLNRGSMFIGGSYLDTYLSVVNPINTSISGLMSVNDEFSGVADDDFLKVSSSEIVSNAMLCGAMPK